MWKNSFVIDVYSTKKIELRCHRRKKTIFCYFHKTTKIGVINTLKKQNQYYFSVNNKNYNLIHGKNFFFIDFDNTIKFELRCNISKKQCFVIFTKSQKLKSLIHGKNKICIDFHKTTKK